MGTRLGPGGYPVTGGSASPSTSFTGVQATSAAGVINAKFELSLTGVSSTGTAGAITAAANPSISLTAVAATSSVANFTAQIDFHSGTKVTGKGKKAANVADHGILRVTLDDAFNNDPNGRVGTFGKTINNNNGKVVNITPASAIGQADSFDIDFQVDESPSLVEAVGTGTVAAIVASIGPVLTGVEATGTVADFTLVISPSTSLTGVEATGLYGTLATNIVDGVNAIISLPLVIATGAASAFSIALDVSIDDSAVQGRSGVTETGDFYGQIELDISGTEATGETDDLTPSADNSIELTAVDAIGIGVEVVNQGVRTDIAALLAAIASAPGSGIFNYDIKLLSAFDSNRYVFTNTETRSVEVPASPTTITGGTETRSISSDTESRTSTVGPEQRIVDVAPEDDTIVASD